MNLKEMWDGMKAKLHAIFKILPNWVERTMPDILKVTGAIRSALEKGKDWLEGQTAQTIVDIIPGDLDDKVRNTLIALLNRALPVVAKVEDKSQDLGEQLLEFLKKLAEQETEKGANSKLQALSAVMLAEHDGNKLKENMYDSLAQLAFSKLQKKTDEAAA